MTEELKKYLIDEVKKLLPELEEKVKNVNNIQSKTIGFPVIIDGVIDTVYYDIKKQRFTEVEFSYAVDDGGIISADWLAKNTVLCDNTKRIRVPL